MIDLFSNSCRLYFPDGVVFRDNLIGKTRSILDYINETSDKTSVIKWVIQGINLPVTLVCFGFKWLLPRAIIRLIEGIIPATLILIYQLVEHVIRLVACVLLLAFKAVAQLLGSPFSYVINHDEDESVLNLLWLLPVVCIVLPIMACYYIVAGVVLSVGAIISLPFYTLYDLVNYSLFGFEQGAYAAVVLDSKPNGRIPVQLNGDDSVLSTPKTMQYAQGIGDTHSVGGNDIFDGFYEDKDSTLYK